jgi:4-amino-4-deoxy-L-arabinose transferase-like glycosyltransferase
MKPRLQFLSDHFFTILLFVFIFVYILVTYIYLGAHTVPPRWDDSKYLEHSEILFNALHGYESYNLAYFALTTAGKFNVVSLYPHLLGGSHAPLITLLPVPIYFVFGTGSTGLVITFFALILVFNLIFFRFISEITDKPTALLAVVITSTMPLAVGLSRYFAVEYGLMILVTLWVYLQIKSNHFREARYNIWLGVVLGLGMLMKITFPVYVIGAILWGLRSAIAETKLDKRKLVNVFRNGMIVLVVGIGLMGTWYIPNIKPVLSFAFNAGFGGPAQNYSMGNPFDIRVLWSYWVGVINIGISAYYFFVFGLLSLVQGILYVSSKEQSASGLVDSPKIPIGIMLAWFLVPFIIFSFGVNKETRYLLPALPPIGFIVAKRIVHFFYKNDLGKAAIVLMIAFPCFLFGYISLPLSSNYSLQAGPFLLLAPEIGWATRPVRQSWPLEQILFTINEDARKNDKSQIDAPIFIGIVPNYQYFNINNLGYFAAHHKLPFTFELFEPPLNGGWTVQRDRIVSKDYLITKTGDQGPSFAYNPYLTPLLLNGELPFNELARCQLPDGSDGIIYKRGVVSNKEPSILRFLMKIKLGDQFGTLALADQNQLFIHPGATTPTQFELDAAAFTEQKGEQTIKITGAMHPDVPAEAVKSGGANVRLIIQVANQPDINTVIRVGKPVNAELVISNQSPVLFIVENNGNPNTDWFLLSIE